MARHEQCDAQDCSTEVKETEAHYLGPYRLCTACCDQWLDDAALHVETNP